MERVEKSVILFLPPSQYFLWDPEGLLTARWLQILLVCFRWRIFLQLVPCHLPANHSLATSCVKAPSAHGRALTLGVWAGCVKAAHLQGRISASEVL